MWRNIASNAVTFLIVGLFLLAGVILWGQGQYTSAGPLGEPICLQVERGSTMDRVSRNLEDQGAISNGAIFRIGADYEEKADELKAGSFLIQPGASMAEIVDAVTRGGASTCGTEVVYRVGVARTLAEVRELDPETDSFVERAEFVVGSEAAPDAYTEVKQKADTRYRIALAEGVTTWQVTESLKNMDILEGEVPAVPPEGALAPDSYEVQPGDDRVELLARMQERQVARVSRIWAGRDTSIPLDSPEELLTLASIVEKETGTAEERGTVASVFVNRLRQGMRLQTDPTVIYGVTRGQGVLGRGLRQSELRQQTPWNTYVIDGLPPTPIANPGIASLEATANPPDTPYVFFVARTLDPADGHVFAETLEEHNENVAAYRRLEAERDSSNN